MKTASTLILTVLLAGVIASHVVGGLIDTLMAEVLR